MSHSILTKSNRASCNSSLRATADILLISVGLGTGPWLFNSTLQCPFPSSFLPYLLSPLIIVFGSDIVRAEAAVNTKKDPRDHPEGASDLAGLTPKVYAVFPRLTPRTYIAGSAEKGQGPTFCRCSFPAWCLLHSQHQEGDLQPRAGDLAGVCIHPAAPPRPPSATDKCSNGLRECSFSNPAPRDRTYFKLKGNYPGKSHKKQVTRWKIPAYISLVSLMDQSYHL